MFSRLFIVLPLALLASPVFASVASVPIPEPGDAALFVIAVIGLIVGRHASRRAPGKDNDKQA